MTTVTKDDLYDAAFRYKKAKLWKKLWDSDIFALKLKNGEIGYITVMGKLGEHCAMGIYVGDKAFESYRILQNLDPGYYNMAEFEMQEMMLQQNCLQLVLDTKEFLTDEEIEEARAYAKKHGIRLGGKNAYPHFLKYVPNYHPWMVEEKEDMEALHEAAEACILLADELSGKKTEEMGIFSIGTEDDEVPVFEMHEDGLKNTGVKKLPNYKKPEFKKVIMKNQTGAAMVKGLAHEGIYESQLIRLANPVQEEEDEAPYYPVLLVLTDKDENILTPVHPQFDYENNPQAVLNDLANSLKREGSAPKRIRCRDERTFSLLKDFGKKTGIPVSLYEGEMTALEEIKHELFEELGRGHAYEEEDESFDNIEDEILHAEVLVSFILNEPVSSIRKMPDDDIAFVMMLDDMGMFEPEISALIHDKIKKALG